MEDDVLDFNFWPSFADLMLTLVLILVIIVFVVIAVISAGTVDLKEVEEKQQAMIDAIAAEYGVEPKEAKEQKGYFVIPIQLEDGGFTEISVQNEPTLQRFSFRDRVLFEPDQYVLKEEGKNTLRVVGTLIKTSLDDIREIQIQGHADTDKSLRLPSNLHLAARRAIEVFNFLQEQVAIDPATHLMSATSFGEFKPVQRSVEDSTYNREKLEAHNRTDELKAQNRRIEILLFYRFKTD